MSGRHPRHRVRLAGEVCAEVALGWGDSPGYARLEPRGVRSAKRAGSIRSHPVARHAAANFVCETARHRLAAAVPYWL